MERGPLMGFFDRLTAQFIEIIEWTDDSRDTMVYRFPVYAKEIKNGAKLVVREGQAAVFIREGKLADVMSPGMYTLDTKNLPILSTLLGWKYGFESPFKCEIYFVSTRQYTDLKWGTQNPIMMRDADFGVVRLRAFGAYAVRISDPGVFIKEIVGTDGQFESEQIADYLRDMLLQGFAEALGKAKVPALDLASNYKEIGSALSKEIATDFQEHGPDPDALPDLEYFRAARSRSGARQAFRNGRGRRSQQIHAIPGRQCDSRRGQAARRHGGHRHGSWRRHGDGQPDGQRRQPECRRRQPSLRPPPQPEM